MTLTSTIYLYSFKAELAADAHTVHGQFTILAEAI
jgi:hypothetical protein